jgi:hypothetical protein
MPVFCGMMSPEPILATASGNETRKHATSSKKKHPPRCGP